MAPEEPPASVPANIDDDIALLAILAVQTNNGNLENLDWDEIAGRMRRERGLDVTAVDCRNEAAEIIEQTTLDLQASAARRRNNNAGHTQASNSAQSHPESSSNAPQRTSVANGGAQPTSSSNNVAHPTQPGNTNSANSTTSATNVGDNGEEGGVDADEEGEA